MRCILLAWILGFYCLNISAQSPHGEDFTIDCKACHSSASWELDRQIYSFQHDTTEFPLLGQHLLVDCKSCHVSLDFSQASTSCVSCHQDIHHQTVGNDCARCHNAESWLVQDITSIHEQNGFPLQGAHNMISCNECHKASEVLRFEPIGNQCISCHQADYVATTAPNHPDADYSTDCAQCHQINSFDWADAELDHEFFPLTGGHDVADCASCHKDGNFSGLSSDCLNCHMQDFASTTSPNHQASGFSTDCATCHTSTEAWRPAGFKEHDSEFFPIYIGTHQGVWSECIECHTTEGSLATFSCTECHEHNHTDTDEKHEGITGYSYSSDACLACHPTGTEDGAFDHNTTNFPLTGAHTTVECASCHINGFVGTSTLCADCHMLDFNQAANPNHTELTLSSDCISCHTTDPGWSPATFNVHNDYYVIAGAHTAIANDCAACHNGDYTNTPNTCAGCHTDEYRATTNPNHQSSGFSNDCANCHSQNAWQPADFDHDAQFFPINKGTHQGVWSECIECHTTEGSFATFSCTECHEHNRTNTDEEHLGISGYLYSSDACLTCHPMGTADGAFDHNTTNFPLTGAHTTVECASCHVNGFVNTSTLCADCHLLDFNQAANPNHTELTLSSDCISCHTTDPGWSPAAFDVHNDYYVIAGAHTAIANDCAACHNGDYANTPNTCAGCHTDDYNATVNPNHQTAGYSQDCASCHSETAWQPANFDHNATDFPLTGAHATVDCQSCHTNGYSGTSTICKDCHGADFSQTTNPNHHALALPDDCASCHSTQPGWNPATFDVHNDYYVIAGAHLSIANDCASCHNGDYTNTPNTCAGCHTDDYNATTNPNHQTAGYSTDCATCHAQTAWQPANFDHSNTNFPLTGAHATVDCQSCHTNGYSGTSTICADCHTTDFNQTTNPNHGTLGLSNECASCHTTQPGWSPATFSVHDNFYVIAGAHLAIANDCASCHNGDYTNTPNTCVGCHIDDYNATTNPNHQTAGYSTDCATCHAQTAWQPANFDHNNTNFPLTGAHQTVDCQSCHSSGYSGTSTICADCHTADFNQTTNPNHGSLGLSNDCASCHTTQAGWRPASFPVHNNYYVLTGAHVAIANDCATCHNGDYINTPNTCAGCHISEYNNINNPPHQASNFPTDCAACHTQNAWEPANFDHDGLYFPIYSGKHKDEWNNCSDCHTNANNYAIFSCVDCHEHSNRNEVDKDHSEVNGYQYLSTACLSCHPTGDD